VYEYLAAGRPVVAVAPASGAVARLLAETGGGVVVDADAGAAGAALEAAVAGRIAPQRPQALAALSLPRIVSRLGDVLAEAAA
jgi:glycosyltransferase involved in cell wall biosynthesis